MSLEKYSNFLRVFSRDEMTGSERVSYRFKSFLLDTKERRLSHNGESIPLTPKVFDTLVYLVEHADHLVEKAELMESVWRDSFVEEGNLTRSIHALRRALGQDKNGNKFIETVPTKGYRFVAPVEVVEDAVDLPDPRYQKEPESDGDNAFEFGLDPIVNEDEAAALPPSLSVGFRWIPLTLLLLGIIALLLVWSGLVGRSDTHQAEVVAETNAQPAQPSKFYWEMTDVEQVDLIRERSKYIQTLNGDDPADLDEQFMRSVKVELDDFVSRNNSVSDRPFREPIRKVYERAARDAEEIADYFEAAQMSGALGIYQAMAESEYHQCLISPTGSVGLFQLTKRTAKLYDLEPDGYCDIARNAEAASRYMADIGKEMAGDRANATLSLFTYNVGSAQTQEYLRELRRMRIWERSAWAILRNRSALSKPIPDSAPFYLARFFAAAVIGETPSAFDLSTPPLSTIRTARSANR